ncbi:MAG: hypothetical protein HRU09_13905 [Oligoflexales bacterium]|nr:hypothetical protein [Oligoflexales bacterium]
MASPTTRFFILAKTFLAIMLTFPMRGHATDQSINTVDFMRNISFSFLRSDYTLEEITQFILYPPEGLTDDIHQIRSPESLIAKEADLAKVSNLDLYKLSQSRLFSYIEDPDKFLRDRDHAITIVLIPGIFGEFIDNRPFEDVLSKQDSNFSREWQEKLRSQSKSQQLGKVFNFKEMQIVESPLSELTSVGSIDDAQGEALVKLIYLRPLFGSLETLGDIANKRSIYQRRLSKVFGILGLPKDIYLMGYSQGANVALDFVSDLAEKSELYPWVENIKGVISLGGVLFGSELSNMARDKTELSHKLVSRLSQLAEELEDNPINWLKIPGVVSRNSLRWKDLLVFLKEVSSSLPQSQPLPQSPNFELAGLYQLLIKIVTQNFELQYTRSYFKNISRFKHFINEAKDAIFGMTTTSRFEWWKNHQLPTWVRYYAISGSMPDPSNDDGNSPLINHLSYGVKTADFRVLAPSYLDIFRRTKMRLNDSQVAIHQTLFWPKLHQELNPKQQDYQTHYLGVLGTHHWGFAFPSAFESNEHKDNPYPRTTILKSIASSIAYTEKQQ